MRNIWAYLVGGTVLIGAIIVLQDIIGDDGGDVARTQASAPQSQVVADPGKPLVPDATFDMVEIAKDDYTMGQADAPITIVEYASLTCPHCANFHANTLPGIKTDFIDKGLVRLIYRDFPLDQMALTGSMLARCAGRDRYFPFIEALYSTQQKWSRDQNPVVAMSRIALLGGMNQAKIDACLKDTTVAEAILKQRIDGQKAFGIKATPTLIINGKLFSGGLTLDEFRVIAASMTK
jgi:protein-disulfide isomerase